jgi:hypothetical protein
VLTWVLTIVVGLLINELCDVSPWCARKLVRWSAFRRYADQDRAKIRAEELTALINERPGKLFKLITASCFAVSAVIISSRRAVARQEDGGTGPAPALPRWSHREVLGLAEDYFYRRLTEFDCEMIDWHLEACPICLQHYVLEFEAQRLAIQHPQDPAGRVAANLLVGLRQVRSDRGLDRYRDAVMAAVARDGDRPAPRVVFI